MKPMHVDTASEFQSRLCNPKLNPKKEYALEATTSKDPTLELLGLFQYQMLEITLSDGSVGYFVGHPFFTEEGAKTLDIRSVKAHDPMVLPNAQQLERLLKGSDDKV